MRPHAAATQPMETLQAAVTPGGRQQHYQSGAQQTTNIQYDATYPRRAQSVADYSPATIGGYSAALSEYPDNGNLAAERQERAEVLS